MQKLLDGLRITIGKAGSKRDNRLPLSLQQKPLDVLSTPFSSFTAAKILKKVKGGDSEASRTIGIAHATIKEVKKDSEPSLGRVWFKEVDGKLKMWKCNYDSS